MAKEVKFGERLKSLRISNKKSMGHMARQLGISTVYYSEVEGMRKKPFSPNIDYGLLAIELNVSKSELLNLAKIERSRLDLDLFKASHEVARLALQFGRMVNEDLLSSEQILKIQKVLGGEKGIDVK